MYDISSTQKITKISEIISKIDLTTDTINLNFNNIKKAKIHKLPSNIINVSIDNNQVDEIQWDDREWNTISLKHNKL